MHNTTVGQSLNQPVCQGRFAPISDPKSKQYMWEHLIMGLHCGAKQIYNISNNFPQCCDKYTKHSIKLGNNLADSGILNRLWATLNLPPFLACARATFSKVPRDRWQQSCHVISNAPAPRLQSGGQLIISNLKRLTDSCQTNMWHPYERRLFISEQFPQHCFHVWSLQDRKFGRDTRLILGCNNSTESSNDDFQWWFWS